MSRFWLYFFTFLFFATNISSIGSEEVKKKKMGAAVYGTKNEFMQLWINAYSSHPAISGSVVDSTILDGRYDHLVQSNQIDSLITQHYDIAIFIPIDSVAGGSLVHKALVAGLPIVGSNGPVESDELVSYIGSDDVLAGEIVAEAVIKAIGSKGNVVILEGPVGQTGPRQRGEGISKALARYPEIKVLEQKTANWSRNEAMDLMQNWLTVYRGQIDGVIAQNDEMALGAIAAMKSMGIDPSTIPSAGIDGVSDAIFAVSEKEMLLSVRQDAYTQAQGAVDIALRHLFGPDYKPMSNCWEIYEEMPWNGGTDKYYSVPWTIVTPQNASKFLDEE